MTEPTPAPDPTLAVAESAPSRGARRVVIIGSIVALVIVAAGAGAYAFQKLSGGGTQPSEVLPASVLAYARVDVDPSASQKIALLKLIRKFPDAAKSIGIKSPDQDVRKLLFKDAIAGCGLTFDKDIKPWIGNRLGVALLKDAKTPVIAVQVSDEAKARKGINTLMTKCADSPKPGIAFLDGYALVTEKSGAAADVRDAAQKSPLSENKAFIADTKALDGEGFASAWVTAKAFTALADQGGFPPGSLDAQLLGTGSTAMSLRATGKSLELQSVGKAAKGAGTKPSGIADLPAETAVALSAAFGGNAESFSKEFEQGLSQGLALGQSLDFEGGPSPDADAFLKELESETGLKIPEDIATLLGDQLTLAVGSDNLETLPAVEGPDDLARLNVGLAMHSDADKAADLAGRLSDLAKRAGIQLTVEKTSDGAVIATNPAAARMFDGSGKLGAKASFKRVIPDGAKATSAFYVDVAAILDALEAANPPPDVASVIDQLKAISAVGFSTSTADGYTRTSGRITFTH
ncbi:MAG: hypothetical protein JWR83_1333 [Aeromicrobium sp.]|nr:hypothetical protein [Aeromicrobium sp.]